MTSSYPALLAFSKLHPSWEFCAISSSGLSGGILLAWNPHRIKVKDFRIVAGILLKACLQGSSFTLSFLNCYGPYCHHEYFWEAVVQGGFLNLPNLVLAGDLNLTLNGSEVWGKKALTDPLGPYFTHLFSSHQLIDIAPVYAGPTWRNGRSGDDGISKRLDRFLLSSSLLDLFPWHSFWAYPSSILDHFPVILEWKESTSLCVYPFKFNHFWLANDEFVTLIK